MPAAQPVVVQAAQPVAGQPAFFRNVATPKSTSGKGGGHLDGIYRHDGSVLGDLQRVRAHVWSTCHESTQQNSSRTMEHLHLFNEYEALK